MLMSGELKVAWQADSEAQRACPALTEGALLAPEAVIPAPYDNFLAVLVILAVVTAVPLAAPHQENWD